MEEQKRLSASSEEKPFRGLYRNVKISVKALDIIIVCLVAAILLLVAVDLTNPGFTITFDARGGTDVPSQSQMYGEALEFPEPPTREGYVFIGWYTDQACNHLWNAVTDTIQTDMTLYAGWEKIQ